MLSGVRLAGARRRSRRPRDLRPHRPRHGNLLRSRSAERLGDGSADRLHFGAPAVAGVRPTAARSLGYVYAGRHRERGAYRWSVDVTAYVHSACTAAASAARSTTSLFALLDAAGLLPRLRGHHPAERRPASVCTRRSASHRSVSTARSATSSAHWHDVGWWELALCALAEAAGGAAQHDDGAAAARLADRARVRPASARPPRGLEALDPDVVLGEARRRRRRRAQVVELRALQPASAARGRAARRAGGGSASSSSSRTPAPARRGADTSRSRRRARAASPRCTRATSASASTRASATARFRPFAPVGGTMCAASPARKSRPNCIGSTTKLRMSVTFFSSTGPSRSFQPSSLASRRASSSQMRASGQLSIGSSGSVCR